MSSDRIFGSVVVLGALAFIAGAFAIQTSFISDPLGPRVFPILIGSAAFLCGAGILARPDPDPAWPAPSTWAAIAAATVVLLAYAQLIGPLGFLLSTALASAATSWMIRPDLRTALPTGIGLAVLLYIAFKHGLGLGLHALPKALGG